MIYICRDRICPPIISMTSHQSWNENCKQKEGKGRQTAKSAGNRSEYCYHPLEKMPLWASEKLKLYREDIHGLTAARAKTRAWGGGRHRHTWDRDQRNSFDLLWEREAGWGSAGQHTVAVCISLFCKSFYFIFFFSDSYFASTDTICDVIYQAKRIILFLYKFDVALKVKHQNSLFSLLFFTLSVDFSRWKCCQKEWETYNGNGPNSLFCPQVGNSK